MTDETDEKIREEQLEFKNWGTWLLERAGEEFARHLDADLEEPYRAGLWMLSDSARVMRAALALSEFVLSVCGVLARRRREALTANLTSKGLVVSDGRRVPAAYFISRMSEHADMLPDVGVQLWKVIVDAILGPGMQVPGLAIKKLDATQAELSIR